MLHFKGYDDFEDYFGPRWNCYLSDIIATIPVPLVFAKGQFEGDVAARLLGEFAADPYPYLDEAAKKKMTTAQSDLLRKFEKFAFGESAEVRWQESQRTETGDTDAESATERNLQNDLFESAEIPF
jgi:hypothetical protein